jgi:hypothetical protein
MIIGASPTLLPPQLSPDGKWIWDGHQWQPLPESTWEPAAEVVLPQAVAVAAPLQPRIQARPVEIQPQPQPQPAPVSYRAASYPVADYPVANTPVTPLWAEPARSGLTIYMYAGAAAVVLIMLMMVLNSTNIIQLPWPGGASSSAGAQHPPIPKTSDYARADRFLNVYLAPALPSVGHALPALQSACTGTLSNGCLTALNAARQQMTTFLSTLDNGDVPPCITAGAKAARFDLQSMADGLDMSLNGYQDNNGAEVYKGIYRFSYFGRSLKADPAAINAQKAHCSKVIPS